MTSLKTETDTLIIGAGQAGVAMSEHLTRLGIPHLVVEKNRIAESGVVVAGIRWLPTVRPGMTAFRGWSFPAAHLTASWRKNRLPIILSATPP